MKVIDNYGYQDLLYLPSKCKVGEVYKYLGRYFIRLDFDNACMYCKYYIEEECKDNLTPFYEFKENGFCCLPDNREEFILTSSYLVVDNLKIKS